MPSENDAEAGFTILEVLVAFIILSAALVASSQSLSHSVRAFSAAKMSRASDRIAEEILAEQLRTSGPSLVTGIAEDGLQWTLKREGFQIGTGTGTIGTEKLRLEVVAPVSDRLVRRYVTYRLVEKDGGQVGVTE